MPSDPQNDDDDDDDGDKNSWIRSRFDHNFKACS